MYKIITQIIEILAKLITLKNYRRKENTEHFVIYLSLKKNCRWYNKII